jgi:hypothetical protein
MHPQPEEKRLGATGDGVDDVKRHAFFAQDVDWMAIFSKVDVDPRRTVWGVQRGGRWLQAARPAGGSSLKWP